VERSRNTIRSYAHDLDHFFTFLEISGMLWSAVTNETLGLFIRYMRTPAPRRRGRTLTMELYRREETTVNRALAAVTSFARYLSDAYRDDVYPRLARTAVHRSSPHEERYGSRESVGPRMKPFSHEQRVFEKAEREAIIGACVSLRDRFFYSLLDETGMRVGQALLLHHSDIAVQKSSICVRRRRDEGSAERNKSRELAVVPVGPALIRLYAAYMHTEYRLIDSDYVFVNLRGGDVGHPLTYKSVDQQVRRLRKITGITDWSAHSFRHSYVTRLLAAGVPMETVSYLVTHASVATTINTYNHPDPLMVREQLVAAGVWTRG
jgi:site-specific recombinase XerD